MMSPASYEPNDDSESEEIWSPISVSGSNKTKRKSHNKKNLRGTKHPIIDKKERKKVQNVEAARRYR